MTTIHDVAKRAGVSPVTVSRVINGASNVNALTRDRVEHAIEELGYLPNLAARSLRSRQTSTLALIVPDITNAFWTTVARGVEDAAQSGGYLVWLCNSDENLDKQTGYINAVLRQRVDGVMIAPYDGDPAHLRQLRERNTPTVVVDREVTGWEVDTVRSDSISGSYALVQHLIQLGHRRIAMVSGPSGASTAEERVAGYCLALEDAGIEVDSRLIRRGEYRARSGQQMTGNLFEEGLDPTAIVAANNVIAMGVFEALQAHGKTVPGDVALVCFDELPDLARFYPFLTVAVQPAYDMGINAAQLLLSRIMADAPLQPRRVTLPTRLVLRHSCGRFLKRAGGEPAYPAFTTLQEISETVLVRPLDLVDGQRIQRYAPGLQPMFSQPPEGNGGSSRLYQALHHQAPEQLPHVEASINSHALIEYTLERSLPETISGSGKDLSRISPTDWVAFAQRVGLDAVECPVEWQSGLGRPKPPVREQHTLPGSSLVDHFTKIESFLRAARASHTGIFVSLNPFYDEALEEYGGPQALTRRSEELGHLLDRLENRQEAYLRAMCDRFAGSLTFITLRDQLLERPDVAEIDPEILRTTLFPRLARVIRPALEHDLVVGFRSSGRLEPFLADLYAAGFRLIQSIDMGKNPMPEILEAWKGKLVFSGGFPVQRLTAQLELAPARAEVETQVRACCETLASRPGMIFGVSPVVTADIRPELYLAMAQALHRCGKWKPVE